MGRYAAISVKIALTAVLSLAALSLAVYALAHGPVLAIYKNWARVVVQVECGQVVDDPRLYVLRPGTCHFANGEFDTMLRVDADGYRNDPALMGTGPVKVAVAGDSHALGWGVADAETFSSLLAKHSDFTVRNLAMSSYGTAREMITLRRLAPDARVVILQYCDNDYRENLNYLSNPAGFGGDTAIAEQLRDTLAKDGGKGASLSWNRGRKTLTRAWFGWLAWSWRLVGLPPRQPPLALMEPQDLAKEADAFARVMVAHRDYLAGKQVIVFENNNWGALRPRFRDVFQAALAGKGLADVRVMGLSDVLARRDYFHIDEHLTADGHRKLAASLYQFWQGRAR